MKEEQRLYRQGIVADPRILAGKPAGKGTRIAVDLVVEEEAVLAIARNENRILLVTDRDFGELIFHQELAHAGIIFFRLPGASLQTKMEHPNRVFEEYTDHLQRGEFLVVTPGRIRLAGRPHAERG